MTWLYIFLLLLFMFNYIKSYFLLFMLMMEIMVLITVYYTIEWMQMNEKFFMYVLIVAVCESIIGLSLLVKFNFSSGSQKMMFFNL
uniref:NADH dehydrogenase subunit 4L n=1 Tax=Thyreus decorus TaxID=600203 RepID=A0A7U0R5Z2_9HYME|nr:NADH dehydrogenase subunit 4L [Thyreus decorus]QQX27982.1 NADH dehydrogenase subunit 4L [Thyreus decorus]